MDFLWFFKLFFSYIPFSCFIVPSFAHIDFSFSLPSSFSSHLLICLSFCLGCVWPCPSLPLQEVVSRLIESRLRSLELNTCSKELLFNCTSHTLMLTGLLVRTHKANTHCVWSDPKPLPCSCSLSFCYSRKRRDEWKKGELQRWRGNVAEECVSGDGPRQKMVGLWSFMCVRLQASQAEDCWAHLDQSTTSRPAIQSLFSCCFFLLIGCLFVNL